MKTNALGLGVSIIVAVIGSLIAMTAMAGNAPTIAALTNTAAGSALANAGITSTSLPGTVYSFVNVFWALGILFVPFVIIGVVLAHAKGFI